MKTLQKDPGGPPPWFWAKIRQQKNQEKPSSKDIQTIPKPSCGRVSSLDFGSSASTRPCSNGANLLTDLHCFSETWKCANQGHQPWTCQMIQKEMCTRVTCTGSPVESSGGHPHVGNFHVTRILYLSIKLMCIWRNSTMCLSEHRVQTCPHPVHHYVPKSCLATSLAYPSTHILHKVP